jgi:ubiquinone/menaquinone biosynthesis C-methylase UbiE
MSPAAEPAEATRGNAPRPPRASLWQRLWRRPFFKRGFYEIVGLVLLRNRGLQMLNCGYADEDEGTLELPPPAQAERFAYQLYQRVGSAVTLTGRDVLEVGCGAGAGARFLATTMQPRSYLGTDASRMLIRAARRTAGPDGLSFRVARIDRLPLSDAMFDVVLAVEATHALPDKGAGLREIARVLRPGGAVAVADFFYRRETSPSSLQRFHAGLASARLRVERELDWTRQACRALEQDSPRRFAAIERLPRWARKAALAFAGTTESPLYQQLRDGRAVYRHFVLRRG